MIRVMTSLYLLGLIFVYEGNIVGWPWWRQLAGAGALFALAVLLGTIREKSEPSRFMYGSIAALLALLFFMVYSGAYHWIRIR